ncbi:unnamed protein product, partial [marine sediment metagenome]
RLYQKLNTSWKSKEIYLFETFRRPKRAWFERSERARPRTKSEAPRWGAKRVSKDMISERILKFYPKK